MTEEMQKRTVTQVAWRLIPFLVVAYILNFIDRVNLGFAALTMNQEFGFSATVFGWGAGILFFGYFVCGVPSNLGLAKFGARRWVSSLLIVWGILSSCMVFIRGEYSFYFIRFMLGAAEAGFFPGIILYLTYWFPAEYRATYTSRFMFAQPVALMIGSALSGWLLQLDGVAGLAGWRWMFIIEGLPASLMGIAALFYLTNKPHDATWLSQEQRDWLQGELDRESAAVQAKNNISLFEVMTNGRVLLLSLIFFGMVSGVFGVNMWLPQILKSFGNMSSSSIGLYAAIPFLCASVGMVLIGKSSDVFKERTWHITLTTAIAGLTLLASTLTGHSLALTIVLLSLSSITIYACMPIFWTIPPTFLSGRARATGIGFINAIGNLGGFVGPFAIGYIKDATGSYLSGLIFLGVCVLAAAILVLIVCQKAARENKAPESETVPA